jgi:hypothetical protein
LERPRGGPLLHTTLALPYWIPAVVIGSSCLYAVVRGGREEQAAAIYFALATFAAPWLLDRRWAGTQWAMFAVDLGYLVLLLVLALRSAKWWPIPAAAFQLLAILTHVASLIDHQLRAWAYVTAGVIWTYLGLAAIVVGTFNTWRARRQPAAKAAPAMAEPGATRR